MHPHLEDALLTGLILAETNHEADAAQLTAGYTRLVEALEQSGPVATPFVADAEAELTAGIEASRIARGIPEDESFGWVVPTGPAGALAELARQCDLALAVGVASREELVVFVRGRIEPPVPPARVTPAAVRARLDATLRALTWEHARELLFGLAELGVIGHDEVDRRLDAQPADPEPPEATWVDPDPGPLLERWPGPAQRCCGVRVLAVDVGTHGVRVHVDLARNPVDADGTVASLPDEVDADGSHWPGGPTLFLHDDLGTDYLGALAGLEARPLLDRDDGLPAPIAETETASFRPTIPSAAGRVWLASADGALRIGLR